MGAPRKLISRRALLVIAALSIPLGPGLGQESPPAGDGDVMTLGPRQFEFDHGGGAVLCAWAIYITVQAVTTECRLERLPVDDTIDDGIVAMDEFILAHSSIHPTRRMLENFKQRAVRSGFAPDAWESGADGLPQFCSASGRDMVDRLRAQPAGLIAEAMAKLLAVPREPVMNPCL